MYRPRGRIVVRGMKLGPLPQSFLGGGWGEVTHPFTADPHCHDGPGQVMGEVVGPHGHEEGGVGVPDGGPGVGGTGDEGSGGKVQPIEGTAGLGHSCDWRGGCEGGRGRGEGGMEGLGAIGGLKQE